MRCRARRSTRSRRSATRPRLPLAIALARRLRHTRGRGVPCRRRMRSLAQPLVDAGRRPVPGRAHVRRLRIGSTTSAAGLTSFGIMAVLAAIFAFGHGAGSETLQGIAARPATALGSYRLARDGLTAMVPRHVRHRRRSLRGRRAGQDVQPGRSLLGAIGGRSCTRQRGGDPAPALVIAVGEPPDRLNNEAPAGRRRLQSSGRPDLNRGPHRPERCALPGCATPRRSAWSLAASPPVIPPSRAR